MNRCKCDEHGDNPKCERHGEGTEWAKKQNEWRDTARLPRPQSDDRKEGSLGA